jgi:hypothetical protein
MLNLKITNALLLFLLQWLGSSGGDGVSVRLVSEGQIQNSARHVSRWAVNLRRAEVVMRWQCSSFQPVNGKARPSNNRVTLHVASVKGNIKPPKLSGSDQTDIVQHKETAAVFATVAGTGEVLLDLGLDLIDPNAMQGPFDSKVELTITGR